MIQVLAMTPLTVRAYSLYKLPQRINAALRKAIGKKRKVPLADEDDLDVEDDGAIV